MGTQTLPSSIPSVSTGATIATGFSGQAVGSGAVSSGSDIYIDQVFVHCGGNGGTRNFTFGVFDTGTTLLAGTNTTAYGSGFGWNHGVFSTPYHLGAGVSARGGFFADGPFQFHQDYPNGHYYIRHGGSGIGNFSSFTTDEFGFGGDVYFYFTYFPSLQVTAVSQTPVGIGQTFTLTGRSFTATISAITIHGAAGDVGVTSYTVDSDTQITCTLPGGATTGTVEVNSNVGSATSSQSVQIAGGYYKTGGVLFPLKGMFYKSGGVLFPVKALYYKSGGVLNPIK